MANKSIIELLDDMHLSSQSKFLDYYYAMQSNNISYANTILNNNPSLSNQLINSQNMNYLINGINERELEPKNDIDYYLNNLLNEFQIMINNTRVMGLYDNTKQYYPHNFVYYQEKGYYALSEPPIGTLPTDNQYWLEYNIKGLQGYGGIDLELKYNWSNTVDYKEGDIVIYKNRLWYALADNTNEVPNLNHYPWVIISMPQMPNRTPIQKAMPQSGYSVGDFWFQITEGDEVITTTWSIRQSEPTPRFSSGAFSIGDKIYVVGGILSNFAPSKTNEVYDMLTGTWSQAADMTSDRTRFGYFTIGNIGYVVGGLTDNGVVTNIVESYDPTSNTWSSKANLPIKMITEAVSDGSKGYVFGGVDENDNIIPNGYVYDPTSNTWTATTNKPTATRGHGLIYVNGYIYAIGGINLMNETLGNVEVYEVSTKTFSNKTNMTTPRSYLGLFQKSGKIYAVGGLDKNWYSLDVNEKFNIENNQWETDMPMNFPRSSLTTAVSGSKAFAIGGIDIGISAVNGYVEQYGITDIPSNFDMTIDTLVGGSLEFGITTNNNSTNNFYIDWGDGSESDIISSSNQEIKHTYSQDGDYIVRIIGNSTGFTISNGKNNLKSVDKCLLIFTDVKGMFQECKNLEYIPDNIFYSSSTIDSVKNVFTGCNSLKIIPVGLFDQNINISDFSGAFAGTGVTSIPNGLFNRNNLAENFEDCFLSTSITTIPNNLFDNNINVKTFAHCFDGCTNLSNIPKGLFSNNSYCTNYVYVFSDCKQLSDLSSNNTLFANSVGAKGFDGAFSYCTNLQKIPEGLFKDSINATSYVDVFKDTKISVIPNYTFNGQNASFNLPDNISDIGDYAMNGLAVPAGYFSNNIYIKTIGNNVFSNTISDWSSMFKNATALTSLGVQDMTNVIDLTDAFLGCSALTDIEGFENNEGEAALKVDLDLSSSTELTASSLIKISNSLVEMTPTTIKNLTLGNENLNKLNDLLKFKIVNKYWNLVGWVKPTITSTMAEDIVLFVKGGLGETAVYQYETSLYYKIDLMSGTPLVIDDSFYVDKVTGLVYKVGEEPIEEYRISIIYSGSTLETSYVSKGANNDPNGEVLKTWISNITLRYNELDIYNTSNLVSLSHVFDGLDTLNHVSIQDTSNVEDFSYAFANSGIYEVPQLDFSNAKTLKGMCSNCHSLDDFYDSINKKVTRAPDPWIPNTHSWYLPLVEDMSYIFENCNVTPTVPNMTTPSLKNISHMFDGCSYLKEVPSFNAEQIIDASYMCNNCSHLQVLPSLTFTNNCINMSRMFYNCNYMTEFNITNWDTSSCANFSEMFRTSANDLALTLVGNKLDLSSATNISNMVTGRMLTDAIVKNGTIGLAYPNTPNYTNGDFTLTSSEVFFSLREELPKMFAHINPNVSKINDPSFVFVGKGYSGGTNTMRINVTNNIYNNNWQCSSFRSFTHSEQEAARKWAYDMAELAEAGIDYDKFTLVTEEDDYFVFSHGGITYPTQFLSVDKTIGFVQSEWWREE